MQETQQTWVLSLDQEDPLEEQMATHSSTLAWRIPWTEEHGRLGHRVKKSGTWLKWLSIHACMGFSKAFQLHLRFCSTIINIYIHIYICIYIYTSCFMSFWTYWEGKIITHTNTWLQTMMSPTKERFTGCGRLRPPVNQALCSLIPCWHWFGHIINCDCWDIIYTKPAGVLAQWDWAS